MADRLSAPPAVDVFVAGGTVRAVAAAAEAAKRGLSVMLAAPRLVLGDELAATLQLWLRDGESADGELTAEMFASGSPATPHRVKTVLDRAILQCGIAVRFGCLPVGASLASDGRIASVTMAARQGVFTVGCGTVIDATDSALIAAFAGAAFRTRPGPKPAVRRIVLAPHSADGASAARSVRFGDFAYFEYDVPLRSDGDAYPHQAALEQTVRDRTAPAGTLRSSERIIRIPDRVLGDEPLPDGLYVLGPCTESSVAEAESLLRPSTAERAGRRIGDAAAEHAVRRPAPPPADGAPFSTDSLPQWGHWDVVVVGGGTAGACAAIGAARQGCRVLVTEFQEGLGGTGTVGLIGRPYHGQQIGFAHEVPFPGDGMTIEDKMEWYRRELRSRGVDVWLGALGFSPLLEGNRATGIALATRWGAGKATADVLVDATGNADLAIAAGADWRFGALPEDLALQGAGCGTRPPGATYVNSDFLLVDEGDPVDVSRALIGARLGANPEAYDTVPLLQTRERRTVVGDHTLSYLDQIAGRTYPDSIVSSCSDYDSHGYPSLSYFALLPHDEESSRANHPAPGGRCFTPYRCLLPEGMDGILVAGIGISMHRDASALVRMQHDLHNQGYAAGVAAAMISGDSGSTRDLDVRALQRHLIAIGNLPPEVLGHEHWVPPSNAALHDAMLAYCNARNPSEAGKPLALLLAHGRRSHPIVAAHFADSAGDQAVRLARLLGHFGDPQGVPALVDALSGIRAWDPKILQGKMAEYAHLPTPVDSLILAVGWTKDERGLPEILRMTNLLDATVTLSHHRAVALALETIGSPRACAGLRDLLCRPGMRGHAQTRIVPLRDKPSEKRRRTEALREIVLARALYRCGDCEGLGASILREYCRDLRSLLGRHAGAVLRNEGSAGCPSTSRGGADRLQGF